jgi:hypothetical protein
MKINADALFNEMGSFAENVKTRPVAGHFFGAVHHLPSTCSCYELGGLKKATIEKYPNIFAGLASKVVGAKALVLNAVTAQDSSFSKTLQGLGWTISGSYEGRDGKVTSFFTSL